MILLGPGQFLINMRPIAHSEMFGSEIATLVLALCLTVALVLSNYSSGKAVFEILYLSLNFLSSFCRLTSIYTF